MPGTVLVIGATGKTGRSVVSMLAERGETLRAVSRNPGRASETVPTAVFDWTRPQTWEAALADADRVYLVQPAGVADATGPVGSFVRQATDGGVRRIVLLSALGVDAAPDGVPLKTVERLVQDSGVEWTILRPNWFMQNFSESFFLPPILDRGELPAPTGDARVSFIDSATSPRSPSPPSPARGTPGRGIHSPDRSR